MKNKKTNKTAADIVAMLRRFACGKELSTDEIPSFTSLADQIEVIEAAHKQEVADLNRQLDSIAECAKKLRWPSHSIDQYIHDVCVENIIDIAKKRVKEC